MSKVPRVGGLCNLVPNFVFAPSTVQTLTSDELREHVFGWVFSRKCMCTFCCKEGGEDNVAAAAGVELNLLQNGIAVIPSDFH